MTLTSLKHLVIKHVIVGNYGMNTIGTLDTMVAMGIMNDVMNDRIIIKTSCHKTCYCWQLWCEFNGYS